MNGKQRIVRRMGGLLVVALLLSLVPWLGLPLHAQTSVFINEIHYDNAGTDTGEAIEIAGPAGTDLNGWWLVLYNGNGGASYSTSSLVGVIPDQQNGYGTLDIQYPTNGIQNGAPDGIALVDGSTVVQFLSYEGTFTAVGGPADGMTSTDIGVSESSDTAVGTSLQLVGTGFTYEDFTWSANVPNTFAAVNTGQTFADVPPTPTPTPPPVNPGDVVINEIMQNPSAVSDSAGEWFELYNATSSDIDIDGWTIADNDTDSHVISNGGPLVIPAGGYLVLGNNTDQATNGGVPVAYSYGSSWFLSNSADEVVLLDDGLTEIDRVEYDNGATFPDPNGASMSLLDPALDNNVGANWCTASTPFGDGDLGTPGAENDCALPTVELVINEIMQNPSAVSDSVGEWFELYNATGADVDIDGWTIEDNDYDHHVIDNGGPLVIPAGGYLVLGNNTDQATNGGVPVAYSYGSSWFLSNSADEVVLLDDGLTEIDRVEYDNGATFPDPNGASMSLQDPALDNNLGANWCAASTPFGDGDLGTPGAENDCALPTVELVINEIDYDQPSTDTAEFLEIRNNGSSAVYLSGFALELVNGTGGGASIYKTINLPGVSLPAGDYFVVCANAATVANCDLDVDPDTNLIQNGAPDAVALVQGAALIDAVSYEGDSGAPYTEGSGAGLEDLSSAADMGISRCPDGTDTDQNNVDFAFTAITPGAANTCEACGDPSTPIYEVQGSGMASPLVGTEVAVEGIVVGDFQNNGQPDNGDLNGFYIQDPAGDGDTATSDGVFVYAPGSIDVSLGDGVRVRGYVDEYFELTEITSVSQVWLCSTGNDVAPTALSLPVASLDDFEPYEGMLVTLPQALYISEYYNFDRFGEIVLTTERQFQPTATYEPGSPEAAQLALANSLSRITLDDGRGSQNPDPAIHPNGSVFDLTNLFRGGDTVHNVTGVMDYSFSLYRIQPTQGADYTSANPRTPQPDDVGGNLTVASFNVLNYFTTIDDSGPICGPQQNQDCRGADTPEEFTRQRDKIIAALAAIDADVVGLIEIENHPGDVPTADLVSGLNAAMGAGTYEYIATGAIGSDAIRQALIYKPATVSPMGAYAILDSSVDSRFIDTKNRPVLAQTFQDNATGGIFTVAVNHLKSKGSPCDDVGDPDLGDGAGNCNLTRKAAAEALVDWLVTDPTGSGDGDFLIIGDLNSYDKEDPIDVLVAGGYTDLLYSLLGENAYSYVFDGQLGYLDHALANPDLLNEVTGVTVWHINADEPDLIDYDMTYKQDPQDALYEPNAYRSSDHDPVINGLSVCDEIAPTLVISVTPDMLWPPNHKYATVEVTVEVTDNFDPNPVVTLVSVESNEPDDGLGDGDTPDDIVINPDGTFSLRAERSGTGDGRIYTITYQATDACGNSTQASATVTVPHDEGKGN